MKKLSLVVITLVALAGAGSVYAFGGKGNFEQHLEHRLDRMQDKLDLTEEQKSALKALFEAKHAQVQADREAMHEQIKSNLTAEQAELFDEMKDRRGGFRGRCKD